MRTSWRNLPIRVPAWCATGRYFLMDVSLSPTPPSTIAQPLTRVNLKQQQAYAKMRFFPIEFNTEFAMRRVKSALFRSVVLVATFLATTGSCLCIASCLGQERVFFVSPDGDDAEAGTEQQPFATIGRSQRAVRELMARSGLVCPSTEFCAPCGVL